MESLRKGQERLDWTDGQDGLDRRTGRTRRTDWIDGQNGRARRTDRTDLPDGQDGRSGGQDGSCRSMCSTWQEEISSDSTGNLAVHLRFPLHKTITPPAATLWFTWKRCSDAISGGPLVYMEKMFRCYFRRRPFGLHGKDVQMLLPAAL